MDRCLFEKDIFKRALELVWCSFFGYRGDDPYVLVNFSSAGVEGVGLD